MMRFSRSSRLAGMLVTAVCLLPATMLASAQAPEEQVLADDSSREYLTEYLQELGSYRAHFVQTVTDSDGGVREQSTGRFWLARPDQFRWEYQSPWPQLILTDGDRIWLYDEDLEQVTVRLVGELLARTPAGLLAGNTKMLDDYRISERVDEGSLLITLIPLAGRAEFSYIELQFVDEQLSGMRLEDQLGQLTLIEFTEVELNPSIDQGLFHFAVPAGVDVIDETT